MAAHDATLTEALALLRGPLATVANAVLHNGVVLWVGSGISRTRFPPLSDLLLLLLQELFNAQDAGNPNCAYRAVSRQIVGMTSFIADPDINLKQDPLTWPDDKRQTLLKQLENQYPDVFGIPLAVPGAPSLAWNFLRLQDKYGDGAVQPDAEHRLLALLAVEGAVSEVITTNWDALIEHAYAALGCAPCLEIVACAEELNRSGDGVLVFKIHGCAERMRSDSVRYGPWMIITRNDINRWAQVEFFMPFREQVRTLLRARPAIFVGLSGQDFNLQLQCITTAVGGVEYAFDPPRIAFTVTEITAPQTAILSAVYGPKYAPNAPAANERAKLPLYGKPLFGGLFVMLFLGKLECLYSLGRDQFPFDELRVLAEGGIRRLETFLTTRFDAIGDPEQRWRTLAAELPRCIARMLSLFRDQRIPATQEMYQPIDLKHPGAMAADPNISSANLHWLLLAGVLLEEGRRQGIWTLQVSSLQTGEDGQFFATVGTHGVAVFLLNRTDVAQQRLETNAVIQPGSGRNCLLIYPAGAMPMRVRRSPTRSLPGTASTRAVSEIWLQELAEEASTAVELLDMLRSALITAQPV